MMTKTKFRFFLLACVLLFFSGLPCRAQDNAYRLGPSDVISLTIYAGGEKQDELDLTVSSAGTINVPFVGTVDVRGLTPTELEKRITEPLARDYFVNPKVNISIKEYHSLHYYISGAVKAPGLYEMTSRASLLELIAKAGGVVSERGNVAYIMRGGAEKDAPEQGSRKPAAGEPLKVDLARLLDKGDMTANPVLESGDVVYIPLKTSLDLAVSKVYVDGEVKTPGIYDYQPGMTAMNACVMAGGFDKFAAPNRTRIIRQKDGGVQVIKIDLDKVKKGKIPDVELKPGDRIHVPETWL